MKLTDLNPQWIGSGGEGVTDSNGNPVPAREGVGMIFDCPCGCGVQCYVGFANPLDGGPAIDQRPRWNRVGDSFDTLTLKPSIHRIGDSCGWHGFITDGKVTTV